MTSKWVLILRLLVYVKENKGMKYYSEKNWNYSNGIELKYSLRFNFNYILLPNIHRFHFLRFFHTKVAH